MSWILWALGTYIFMGGVCVWHDVRSQFKDNLKELEKYEYDPDERDEDYYKKKPRRKRTHEEQVRAALSDSYSLIVYTFFLWPLYIGLHLFDYMADAIAFLIGHKEIKNARVLDEEKKTKEILARFEEEDKKKFDGL
jgi:hypothetical protein